jgi:hypothetical protein
VTTPVLQRAPGWQYGLRVASNGSMALAVWNDQRHGDGVGDVTACRISADGTPMDPLGIVVRSGSEATDVFWTGRSFAVVTAYLTFSGYRADSFYEVTYVDTDGAVTAGNLLAADWLYAGHLGGDADTRLLFLTSDDALEYGSFVGLDGSDETTAIPASPPTFSALYRLAASSGSNFLVLRGFQAVSGYPEAPVYGPVTFSSEVLELDGTLDVTDPRLPTPFVPAALTGDGHGGYALFGYRSTTNEFVMLRLDAKGVVTGFPQFIQPYYPDPDGGRGPVYATTFGGDVFASWSVPQPNGHTYTYLSRNGGIPVSTSDMAGSGHEAAYEPVSDLLLTSFSDPSNTSGANVFVQKGTGAPAPLTYSANPQSHASIAAGSNGFLAAWTEHSGADARLYVRRFTADGAPMDDPQLPEPAEAPSRNPIFETGSVTSSGDTYLVMWNGAFARRLDARSGQWLDGTPFPLSAIAAASNGSDVLALTAEKCPSDCTVVRSVSMSGAPTVSDGVALFDYKTLSPPVIASDGQNYLVVWVDPECPSPEDCLRPPGSRVLSMRFRPDGSPIDAAPIVVQSSTVSASMPTVAWNGTTYLVAWMSPAYNGSIAAAYVGTDGAVQPLGTIEHLDRIVSFLKVLAQAGEFVIFSRSQPYEAQSSTQGELNMTLVGGSTFPFELRSRGTILSVDGASSGAHLMLAYERANGMTTAIGRVFLEPLFVPSRTRIVR